MSNSLHLDVPAGMPWIDFTREFDAPVAALFRAHAEPDLVRQWLGPDGYEMDIEQWDFAPRDQVFIRTSVTPVLPERA